MESVLKQRKLTHGEFSDTAKLTQEFKDLARSRQGWFACSYDKKESIDNIFHKIARILCGDAEYEDHWKDIQGYAKICRDRLKVRT